MAPALSPARKCGLPPPQLTLWRPPSSCTNTSFYHLPPPPTHFRNTQLLATSGLGSPGKGEQGERWEAFSLGGSWRHPSAFIFRTRHRSRSTWNPSIFGQRQNLDICPRTIPALSPASFQLPYPCPCSLPTRLRETMDCQELVSFHHWESETEFGWQQGWRWGADVREWIVGITEPLVEETLREWRRA